MASLMSGVSPAPVATRQRAVIKRAQLRKPRLVRGFSFLHFDRFPDHGIVSDNKEGDFTFLRLRLAAVFIANKGTSNE